MSGTQAHSGLSNGCRASHSRSELLLDLGEKGVYSSYTLRLGRVTSRVLSYAALLLLVLFIISPIMLMVVGSLKPEGRVLLEAGSLKAFMPVQPQGVYAGRF